MNKPPRTLTRAQHIERVFGWVTGIIAIASLVGVLILAIDAASGTNCVNKLLGSRNGITTTLIADINTDADAKDAAIQKLANAKSTVEAQAAFAQYQTATDNFKANTAALTAYVNAHPLGKC